jgi:amino acid adenylation domain-containing protein
VLSGRGAQVKRELQAGLRERVLEVGAREGASAFMVLLTALGLVLSRWSGEEEVLVGTAIANRGRVEVEELIGLFVNMVGLRFRVRPGASLREVVAEAREAALGAYAHQEAPFERVVEALGVPRDTSRAPVFQIAFVLQGADPLSIDAGPLRITGIEVPPTAARYDLTIVVEEITEGYRLAADYSTDLYDRATMERLLDHYERVLLALVDDVGRSADRVPLLSSAERHSLVVDRNRTAAPLAADARVHRLFEARAAATPEAIAIDAGAARLTYRELDARANRLARRLRERGVAAETVVGVHLEAGIDQVVAALAVLKAGGAYLPLDPSYPPARLAAMAADARVLLAIATRAGAPSLGIPCLILDDEAGGDEWTGAWMDAGNLAYVIYTSGSTGEPKGVAVSHRSLVNLCAAQQQAFDIRPGRRVLAFAAFGFDASVSEIFVTLLAGATLVVAPPAARMPGSALLTVLREQRVSVVTLPPSALGHMDPAEAPGLETLVCAGESLPPALAEAWSAGRTLINAYGPTEATVCATVRGGLAAGDSVTIGRPLQNVEAYVLDERLEPQPLGVAGELWIGGAGLARGYLGRPALTAERFVPDPFSSRAGDRLYRTGDRARVRADGEIDFLGRRDGQVKLRGFRIELGEVEAALAGHPEVAEAAVVVREDVPGDPRLVAYVTSGARAADPQALRAALRERLPEHMVPGAVVVLPRLPRTAAGKLDRSALPRPETTASVAAFAPAESDLERRIAAIWCEVLGLERVSVHQAFFDVGGHSLLLVRVHARLEAQLGGPVPLMLLFAHPTVRALAAALSGAAPEGRLEESQARAALRRASVGRRQDARRAAREAGNGESA